MIAPYYFSSTLLVTFALFGSYLTLRFSFLKSISSLLYPVATKTKTKTKTKTATPHGREDTDDDQNNNPSIIIRRIRRPCEEDDDPTTTKYKSYEFCDPTLPLEQRLSSILSLLTPAEKISLLGNTAAAVPRLSLPLYEWWNEGLHGVASTAACCPPHHQVVSTSFPQVCALGVSFNRTLYAAIGDAIGTEAIEHFYKTGDVPGLTYWAPNVNLFRDPRWGRGQEVPGEDPYLNGEYAASLIPAMQYGRGKGIKGNGQKSTRGQSQSSSRRVSDKPRIAACCKHFYAYSLEENRSSFNVQIHDPRDLDDSYLPAFQKCVESGVMGFMCSYNAVDSVPSCAHGDMLTDVLRGQWGFDGYITGDCGAVDNIYSQHRYAASPEQAIQAALSAGVDLDCGHMIQEHGMDALQKNILSIDTVDRALRNALRVQFRLGYYDPPPEPEPFYYNHHHQRPPPTTVVDDRSMQQQQQHRLLHNELALDAARQAVVLLKNGRQEEDDEGIGNSSGNSSGNSIGNSIGGIQSSPKRILPLSFEQHQKIALFGPNANASHTMQGNYEGIAPFLIPVKQGIEDLGGGVETLYHKGTDIFSNAPSLSNETRREVCRMARASDAVVLVMGLDQSIEREGLDRSSLTLPGKGQHELIAIASSCAKQKQQQQQKQPNNQKNNRKNRRHRYRHRRPVILIIMSGGPVDLTPYKKSKNIDAILYVGYPGQSGGTAIAETLYGLNNPSGRLTTTVYPASFADQVAMNDMRMRPSSSCCCCDDNEEEEENCEQKNNNTNENQNQNQNQNQNDCFPGRTYRFYNGGSRGGGEKVVYPFGFGMSFSTFTYHRGGVVWTNEESSSNSSSSSSNSSKTGMLLLLSVEVTNEGPMDGAHTVLLFHVGPRAGQDGNPIKSLIGFDKIYLKVGETKQVNFSLSLSTTTTTAAAHPPKVFTRRDDDDFCGKQTYLLGPMTTTTTTEEDEYAYNIMIPCKE